MADVEVTVASTNIEVTNPATPILTATASTTFVEVAAVIGPQGIQGPTGTLAVGAVTTGAVGSDSTVTNVGTSQSAILNFQFPRGAGVQVGGVAGQFLTKIDGTNFNTQWQTINVLTSDTDQTVSGQKTFVTSAVGKTSIIVKALASQTADLMQFQNSAGVMLASMSTLGTLTLPLAPTGTGMASYSERIRANHAISGGGTITVAASGELNWSARIIIISNGRGAHFGTNGYFDIAMPVAGTVITGVGGAANQTVVAAGIPMPEWNALYYILPIGLGSGTLNANFRVVNYTADAEIPESWVLIAARNSDNGTIYINPIKAVLRAGDSHDATKGTGRSNFVTLADNQTVSGLKTFTGTMTTGEIVAGGVYGGARYSNAMLSVYTGNSSNPGIIVRGFAGQTADLHQWQDSSGASVARVSSNGSVFVTSTGAGQGGVGGIHIGDDGKFSDINSAHVIALISTSDAAQGTLAFGNTPASRINGTTGGIITHTANQHLVIGTAAGSVTHTVRAAATQTANIAQWQNSGSVNLAGVNSTGTFFGNGFTGGSSTNLAYDAATLELIELSFAPRLAFHWSGAVASQITIESNGTIAIRNNPGTGYEKFRSGATYAEGNSYLARSAINVKNFYNGTGGDSVRTYDHVAAYRSSSAALTGAIVFKAPYGATSHMQKLSIEGYTYDSNGPLMMEIGLYNTPSGAIPTFANLGFSSEGSLKPAVRVAYTPAITANMAAPGLSTATTGGTITSGGTYSYRISALVNGGETAVSPNSTIAIAAALASPVNAAFSTATTGGTLVSGTYAYQVTATNAVGETLASTETSIVVPVGTATNTVTVNWAAVTGATGYKVYGRTATTELFISSVGAVTTYTDTGAVTPAGALPTANTTATSTNTVTVSWPAVASATGYRVWGRAAGSELLIASVGAVTSYLDTGIAAAGAQNTTNTTMSNSKMAIILGDVNTVWAYPQLAITRIIASHSGTTENLNDGWTSSVTTSLADFGSITTVPNRDGFFQNITVTAATASSVPAIFKGAASQTADLTQWQNSAGQSVFTVQPSGDILLNGDAGTSVGRVSLGNVNHGLARGARLNAGAGTNSVGLYTAGGPESGFEFWHATTGLLFKIQGDTKKASLAGDLVFGGLTGIEFNGGTLKGAGSGYVQLGENLLVSRTLAVGSTFVGSQAAGLFVGANSNSVVADKTIVARIMAGQTGDIQQWQDNAGASLTRVAADGSIYIKSVGANAATETRLYSDTVAAGLHIDRQVFADGAFRSNAGFNPNTTGTANTALTADGVGTSGNAARLSFATNASSWALDVTVGTRQSFPGAFRFNPTFADLIGVVIKGAVSQTADLQQWQNSAGTILANVQPSGSFFTAGNITANGGDSRFGGGVASPIITLQGASGTSLINVLANAGSAGDAIINVSASGTAGLSVFRFAGNGTTQISTATNGGGRIDYTGTSHSFNSPVSIAGIARALGRFRAGFNSNVNIPPLNTSAAEFELTAQSLITIGESAVGDANPSVTLYRTYGGFRQGTGMRLIHKASSGDFAIQYGATANNSTDSPSYGTETYADLLTVNPTTGVNTQGVLAESGNRVYSLGNKVPVAGLSATGTQDATTFLRGDNTWAAINISNMVTTDTNQTITGYKTLTPGLTIGSTTVGATNRIDFANSGVGGIQEFRFLRATDSAGMRVSEPSNDSLLYEFYMADNPDGGDFFSWNYTDFQGAGAKWEPLRIGGIVNEYRAREHSFYGNINQRNSPWFSANGTPDTVAKIGTGTLTVAPNVNAYSGNTGIYWVQIDGVGTPNTFKWGNGSVGNAPVATLVPITGAAQTLNAGVTVTFNATTGGVLNDSYQFRTYAGGTFTTGAVNTVSLNASSQVKSTFEIMAGGAGPLGALSSRSWATNVVTMVARSFAGQTADLQQWQNSAGTILAKVNASGTMTSSAYNTVPGSSETSIFGAVYAFPSAAALYVGTFGASNRGLIVAGAASQTGDLQQWQNSAGGVLAFVGPGGIIKGAELKSSGAIYGSNETISITGSVNEVILATATAEQRFRITSTTGWTDSLNSTFFQLGALNSTTTKLFFQAANGANLQRMGFNADYGIVTDIPFNSTPVIAAQFAVATSTAAKVVSVIRSAAAQTADLTQWQNSAGSVLARIASDGTLYIGTFAYNSSGSISPNAVTTDTVQTITAAKTFSGQLLVSSGDLYVTGATAQIKVASRTAGDPDSIWYASAGSMRWFAGADRMTLNLTTGALNTTGAITENGVRVYSASNLVPVAGLSATGTRDATTFLRGDNTWAAINISNMVTTDTTQTITGTKTFGSSPSISVSDANISFNSGGFTGRVAMPAAAGNFATGSVLGDVVLRGDSVTNNQRVVLTAGPSSSLLTVANNLTTNNGQLIAVSNAAGTVPLVARAAASQTADIQQWQNSAGTASIRISAAGDLYGNLVGSRYFTDANNTVAYWDTAIGGGRAWTLVNRTAANHVASVRGAAAQTGDLMRFEDSAGAVLARVANDGTIYKGTQVVGGNAADTEIMAIMGGF